MQTRHLIPLLALVSVVACGRQEPAGPAEPEMPPVAETPTTPQESPSVAGAGVAAPATDAGAGDLTEHGRIRYNSVCAGCHGKNGEGQGMFPKVAGQGAEILAAKLRDYKAGKKLGPQSAIMHANSQNLSEQDIEALAAHMAGFGG
ncbi:MAG TPA: c-type cytochrome [Thiobacillaceae bacterium]|nr:c-type cytochrome [Thiobacillaceae bacterium]HNU65218.1 c-type cytochrome [Thiobacillaceae bacterium]